MSFFEEQCRWQEIRAPDYLTDYGGKDIDLVHLRISNIAALKLDRFTKLEVSLYLTQRQTKLLTYSPEMRRDYASAKTKSTESHSLQKSQRS